MKNGIVKSQDVVGVSVKNFENEDLGKIEEVILDKHKGDVRYVVLSFGGFLGMGDDLFAMPWKIFSYDENDDCFKINVSKEKLKNSPGFDKDNWPNFNDQKWNDDIHKHYS